MLGRDLYVQTIDYSSSVDDQSDREIVLETPPPLPPNNKVLSSKRSRMQQASANSVPKSKLDFAAEFSHLDKRSSSSDHIYEKDEDNHDRTSSSFKALPQSAHCILAATSSKRSSCKSKDTDCTPPSRDSSESDAKFELSSSDDDDLDDLPSLASAADPKTNSSSSSSKQSKGSSSSAGSFVIDDSEDEEESEKPKPKYTSSSKKYITMVMVWVL